MVTHDQFYTNGEVAERLYEKTKELINIEDYDIILEPSAGTGSFYKLFPHNKRVGLDLEPKYEGIIQQDFLTFEPDLLKTYISIGNPPFGRVSSIAIKFFNKCAEFSDYVCFIIPRTFNKVSVQNKLNLNFHLVYSEDLPDKPCCFNPNMSAKCCYQIWKRSDVPRQIILYDKEHTDFSFIPYGPKDDKNQPTPPLGSDFALRAYGGKCGEIILQNLNILRPKSWHFIKSNIDTNELILRLQALDFSSSRNTVRQNSLGKQELIYLYKEKYG
tara:strand:- start:7059 stop:7874 length:816 start_codon:yes stop_codon:yes gene_type:complete